MIETLDAGGSGLGRDETSEDAVMTLYRQALAENEAQRMALLSQDQDISALHTRLQWRTWFIAVAYIAGFLSCAALTWLGAEAML